MFYQVKTEDLIQEFSEFNTLTEFFTRSVKPRSFDPRTQTFISPCDSKILSVSEVVEDECLLLKGRNYHLGELLTGIEHYELNPETLKSMKKRENTKLISMIFYLAPGDYHRYHAPVDFYAKKRLLIEGYLKPVKISYIKKRPVNCLKFLYFIYILLIIFIFFYIIFIVC